MKPSISCWILFKQKTEHTLFGLFYFLLGYISQNKKPRLQGGFFLSARTAIQLNVTLPLNLLLGCLCKRPNKYERTGEYGPRLD